MKKLLGQELQKWQIGRAIAVLAGGGGSGGGSLPEWNADLANTTLLGSLDLSAQLSVPAHCSMNAAGDELYFGLGQGVDIYTASLTAPYTLTSPTISTTFTGPTGYTGWNDMWWSLDGSVLYAITNSNLARFEVTTPGDFSTAVFHSGFAHGLSAGAQGIAVTPDEGVVLIAGLSAITEFSASTPGDATTLSTTGVTINTDATTGFEDQTNGLYLNRQGTRVYITGQRADRVYEYILSTENTLSSATYNTFVWVGSEDGAPREVWFSDNGAYMLVIGYVNESVFLYNTAGA